MTTFKKTFKNKLSSQIKQQAPDFVLEQHPKFLEFVKQYFIFMESAELTLTDIDTKDVIVLETETDAVSYLLLDGTNISGADKGFKVVDESNTITSGYVKGETITGATSGATATILADDINSNSRLFISAHSGFINGETVTGSSSGQTAKVGKYRANPVQNIQQLLNYSDPDHTISDFLSQMKETFLASIPLDTDDAVDRRKLIKNIKSLYRAKGTARAHKTLFKLLFNQNSEVYLPTVDMLRVSDGKFNTTTFIRATQTDTEALNDPNTLVGQTITQANNPADTSINEATAIVERVFKTREGAVEIIELQINKDTTTGTFVRGQQITGTSNADENTEVKLSVSSVISTTTITNDGVTLTVGDEATITGGAGAGARIQVQDLSEGGVTEVIVDTPGTGFAEGDTLTFSSGSAEAKVSVVGGGFAPEAGSLAVHTELETGTIDNGGTGDLLLEEGVDNDGGGKLLDESTVDQLLRSEIQLEDDSGQLLSEADEGNTATRSYILLQDSGVDIPYNFEADDHIVLEDKTIDGDPHDGNKIVQEVGTHNGEITDVRMIASGSGYTTLPTATISGIRHIELEDETDDGNDGAGRIELETGGLLVQDIAFPGANGTVVPFGDNIGAATSLKIVEHGINFTSAPTLSFPKYAILKTISGTVSADETFTSNVSGATGTVVSLTGNLLKYTATTDELEVGDTVTFSGSETATVVKADTLAATAAIDTKVTTTGKFINQDGHISESSKKIQDSLYYQDYSYVIRVGESINKWRDAIKSATHPAGFYVTGEVNIATQVSAQVSSPVVGVISGASDDPIFSIVNTLFTTVFGRRLGTLTDGTTKRTSLQARTGENIDVSDDYNAVFSSTTRDLDLKLDIQIEVPLSGKQFSLTARGTSVDRGRAYAGPTLSSINRFALSSYSPVNGIELEEGTGEGEIILEDGGATSGAATGSIQLEQDVSFPVSLAEYDALKFIGTGDTSVDGESVRIGDLDGSLSSGGIKTNLAFPCEITSKPT
tara:strand:- start:8668 stop:11679 length:3012 start_codon:yes stop_codon:yes gene_type:complete